MVGVKARIVKIGGHRVPSFDLDQVNVPDPLAQELCRLEHRVYINEQKLRDGKHDENPAKTEETSETGQK